MSSIRMLVPLLLACLLSLLISTPVLGMPPLPSSFYGTVEVNGDPVPDDTLVRGLIEGKVFAEGRTLTYQGASVYALDIPGDDSDTPARDGGREGDVIQFEVGGVLADQTAVWHGGTNVELNLTVRSARTLATPPPTPSPVPTQTPIVEVPPTPRPSPTSSPAPTSSPTADPQPSTSKRGPRNSGMVLGAVAAAVIVAASASVWMIRRRS